MSRIHAFLAGTGTDHRGRSLAAILAYGDAALEQHHDFIQWLFPLDQPSRAVLGAPVLEARETDAIRADPAAQDGLRRAAARLLGFYAATDGWLGAHDHNHLRITRILASLHALAGPDAAQAFHGGVLALLDQRGHRVNAESLRYWRRAAEPLQSPDGFAREDVRLEVCHRCRSPVP